MPLLGYLTSIRRESCPSVLCLKRAYPCGFRHRLLGHVTSSSHAADLFLYFQTSESDHHTVLDED